MPPTDKMVLLHVHYMLENNLKGHGISVAKRYDEIVI